MAVSRITRRWLFTRGAAAAVTSAGVGAALASADEPGSDAPPTASTVGSVIQSYRGRIDVRLIPDSRVIDSVGSASQAESAPSAIPNGADHIAVDAALGSGETWSPGQEVVLVEEYSESHWHLSALQRMYRPLGGLEVTRRNGSTLETAANAKLRLSADTVSRGSTDGSRRYSARPLSSLGDGDVVEGIGYLTTGDCPWVTVEQIGVQAGE